MAIFSSFQGEKKCLWREVPWLKTTPMCHGVHICSIQAQPKSAGVKMPVVYTKWWKWRQIIFWKVPIFPNFVNSACIKISFAFSPLSCCIWGFIKVSQWTMKIAFSAINRATRWPNCHLISSPRKCLESATIIFIPLLKNELEKWALIICIELLRNISVQCTEDLEILWLIGSVFVDYEASELQITVQTPLILLLSGLQNSSRWFWGNDTLNY